ncbi:MAG: ArsC/Spx/MgsR family protein, partial [Syntrophomonadaceae bacterium]
LIKEPLDVKELGQLAQIGRLTIKEMVNPKSQSFKKIMPDLDAMTEEQIMELIKSDPRILRRPIIADEKGLMLGFSEGAYQERLA